MVGQLTYFLLYTLPMKINTYVPILIDTLEIIVWGRVKNADLEIHQEQSVTFFTLLAGIIFL